MTMYRTPHQGRQTTPLDIAYLGILISTFAVTGFVMFVLGPGSWFHRHKNASFSLLFVALGVCGVINLLNASAYGKIWAKCGPVYRAQNPKLFAMNYAMNVTVLIAVALGIVALLFFLPQL
jgi:hypothetical protein